MSTSNKQAELIFHLNTRLFNNALEGITDAQAKERISDHNNPIIWLAVHTTWARYNTCGLLGKPPASNPYSGLFENFKAFDPAHDYGTLAAVKAEWEKASALLSAALKEVSADQLAAKAPFTPPIGDDTIYGGVTFLAQHESYDIGQMAFLKKYFSKEAMRYK